MGRILMTTIGAFRFMYYGVVNKLRSAQQQIVELNLELQKRDEKLDTLITTIEVLKQQTDANERRMERQRHELKEQNTALREMYMALRMRMAPLGFCDAHLLVEATEGENSKAFWVLRKHQRSLVATTKPHIQQIIKLSVESGLISKTIGEYAENCETPHDCTDGFYKALLVKVGESPEALRAFLDLMQAKLKTNCRIFDKMLNELSI